MLLETLLDGPQHPRSLLREKSFQALKDQGLAIENRNGSFSITQEGEDILKPAKMGRPLIEMDEGPFKDLVDHFGGKESFAALVGVHPLTVTRWGRGEMPPSGPASIIIERLTKESGLPSPFTEAEPNKKKKRKVSR